MIFQHRKRNEVIKHHRTQTAVAHDWRNQSSWNKFEHAAKVTTYALIYINEVLRYQFVHRKISTLTFGTYDVCGTVLFGTTLRRFWKTCCLRFQGRRRKKWGHFLSKRWYIIYDTSLQYVAKVSKLCRHRFILEKNLDSSLRQHSTILLVGPSEETNNVWVPSLLICIQKESVSGLPLPILVYMCLL